MINIKEIQSVVSEYDLDDIAIGIFGSHSAKEIGAAAKVAGFRTVLIAEKGRENIYTKFNKHLYDKIYVLDSFKDMVKDDVQEKLRKSNVIFIPNRSFTVYVGADNIEDSLLIPIYGDRFMLRTEDRGVEKNQYYFLEKAGIRMPKKFNPEEIDRLCIVKVQQKYKPTERAYFYASSPEEFYKEARERLNKNVISKEGLEKARIEEYVLGPKFNSNYHGFALIDVFGDFDFVGFSDRIQANKQGFLDLPTTDQLKISDIPVKNEEVGHKGQTMRESLQPTVYEYGEKFRRIVETECPPGMIGSFSLQGGLCYDPDDPKGKKLIYVIFDVSPRVPGDPCMGPTSPEMRILSLKHNRKIEDPLDLSMMEIERASKEIRLESIVT